MEKTARFMRYYQDDEVKEDEMGRTCRMHVRSSYKILAGKHEGKRPHRRPSRRWKGNIRPYLREIGWEGVDWIHLGQNGDQWRAVVNMVMDLQVP
jgi:hypothetical protein